MAQCRKTQKRDLLGLKNAFFEVEMLEKPKEGKFSRKSHSAKGVLTRQGFANKDIQ